MICLRFLRLRNAFPLILALATALVGWMAYARLSERSSNLSYAEPPSSISTTMDEFLQSRHTYAIHDGTILEEPVQSAKDKPADQGTSAPAKVDTLDVPKAYERAKQLSEQTKGRVFKTVIQPHWFHNNTRFWYRNDLKAGTKEFILVDAEKGTRGRAFDHQKLAAALSKAADKTYHADRLPFDRIEFTPNAGTIRFVLEGTWECDLTTYECKRVAKAPQKGATDSGPEAQTKDPEAKETEDVFDERDEHSPPEETTLVQFKKFGKKGPPAASREARSPDGQWTAFTKDSNLFLRDKDGKETRLTENGAPGNA